MTEPDERRVADLQGQVDVRLRALELTPLVCAGVVFMTIMVKILQRDWMSAIALLAPLGLMIVYRQAENAAFISGWRASAFRGSALLEEHAVPTSVRTEVLAHLAVDPTTLRGHRRHVRMMFAELRALEEPTPEAVAKVMRKYR